MGNQKVKWTAEEEDALKAGVGKYGAGKWKHILTDPDFSAVLSHRSNIDLKDKWRNLCVGATVQGSREKSRAPKRRETSYGPHPNRQAAVAPVCPVEVDCVDDPPTTSPGRKPASKYSSMIYEALSSMNDSNGSDISAIARFIEQRQNVPQKFRSSLATKLGRLVLQGKIEKVHKRYKIKAVSKETNTQPSIRKAGKANISLDSCSSTKVPHDFGSQGADSLEKALENASSMIAEADYKLYLAAEAVQEAERVAELAEENESLLLLVMEVYGITAEHF